MKVLHWKRILVDPLPSDKPTDKAAADGADGAPASAPAGDEKTEKEEKPPPKPTLWQLVNEVPFRVADFEAAFGAALPGGKGGEDGGGSKPLKPAITKALDPKRSNAVAIMMSSLPPIHEVKAAIGALDERVLSREQLDKVPRSPSPQTPRPRAEPQSLSPR
jgi:hypothetical protein